jgi:hypothetical protein
LLTAQYSIINSISKIKLPENINVTYLRLLL